MNEAMQIMDAGLIWIFRLPGHPVAGFYLGCVPLALACAMIGHLLYAGVFLAGRRHYADQEREMAHMHNISIMALARKDKAAFLAGNRLANEYFGKTFFAHMALFSTSLVPVPFALHWLSMRFDGLGIPLVPGLELGYTGAFILVYIAVRFGFSRVSHRLPLFRELGKRLDSIHEPPEELLSYSHLEKGLPE